METDKCIRCIRRDGCGLRDLAAAALPSVAEAQHAAGDEWQRSHLVRRALRGVGDSPGFVEDWLLEGALGDDDVGALVFDIVHEARVSLALLARACRLYLGPLA